MGSPKSSTARQFREHALLRVNISILAGRPLIRPPGEGGGGGHWNLHYAPPGKSDPSLVVEANPKPLSQDAFREVLAEMISNASRD